MQSKSACAPTTDMRPPLHASARTFDDNGDFCSARMGVWRIASAGPCRDQINGVALALERRCEGVCAEVTGDLEPIGAGLSALQRGTDETGCRNR